MSLSSSDIKEILSVLEDSGWDEAEVQIGDVTLAVSKNGAGTLGGRGHDQAAAPVPAAALAPAPPPPAAVAAASPAPPAAELSGHVVSAPSVGIFWRAPEPGAAPFVEVGSDVEVGQTLCIVEVMKLMQHVIADAAGTVSAIHCENGSSVEFGTPLFTIAPA
jgi:acetyl-CoA carboxylase biotin carboxyl carrier protein